MFKGTNRAAAIKVSIVTPISSIADMDALSLACHKDYTLLAGSYMLTNDIDYEGKVIYPIATSIEPSQPRTIGIYWKYILEIEKMNGSVPVYKFVDRDNVGKLVDGQTYCHGLTDEQYIALAEAGGINPNGIRQFSGLY